MHNRLLLCCLLYRFFSSSYCTSSCGFFCFNVLSTTNSYCYALTTTEFYCLLNFKRYHLSPLNSRCRHHTPWRSHLSEVFLLQSQICYSLPMSPRIRVFFTSQLHSLLQRTAARLPHHPACPLCTLSLSLSTSLLYSSNLLYQVFVSRSRVKDSVLVPTQAVLMFLTLHSFQT